MKYDELRTTVLMIKVIPSVSPDLQKQWNMPEGHRSVGFFSTDCDDVGYTCVDEATKKADVKVVLAKSMYGGAGCAQQKYAGEFIGPNPAEVKAGLAAAFDLLNADATFYSANDDDSVAYYAYTISRTGSYLSECGGIPEGTPIAYLIAPPVEAQYGMDAALKAADVRMCAYFEPPSGTQSACKAACDAFADAVVFCVENPLKY